MNHPPIPPNCDLKRYENSDRGYSWMFLDGWRGLPEGDFRAKSIVSCYMRCAWQDETARLEKQSLAKDIDDYSHESLWDKIGDCFKNAGAWNEWGGKQ